MKTRKIRGGLFGSNTAKQIKCIIRIIVGGFTSYLTEDDIQYFQDEYYEKYISGKTKNQYLYNKFKKQKSSFEEARNDLLYIFLYLIQELLKKDIDDYSKIDDCFFLSYLSMLIISIIEYNNKGKYYKTKLDEEYQYSSDYEAFDSLVCNNNAIIDLLNKNPFKLESSFIKELVDSHQIKLSLIINAEKMNKIVIQKNQDNHNPQNESEFSGGYVGFNIVKQRKSKRKSKRKTKRKTKTRRR
jgi:hypothetical protein